MININWHKGFLAQWMKKNNVEKASFCLLVLFNEKTDLMEKILFMSLKYDKTKIFKTLNEIETEMGCGIFHVMLNNKKK